MSILFITAIISFICGILFIFILEKFLHPKLIRNKILTKDEIFVKNFISGRFYILAKWLESRSKFEKQYSEGIKRAAILILEKCNTNAPEFTYSIKDDENKKHKTT